MAEKEEKYIVIKIADLERLREKMFDETLHPKLRGTYRKMLSGFDGVILELMNDNSYYVVNTDEPYADAFLDIIIAFETLKEQINEDD